MAIFLELLSGMFTAVQRRSCTARMPVRPMSKPTADALPDGPQAGRHSRIMAETDYDDAEQRQHQNHATDAQDGQDQLTVCVGKVPPAVAVGPVDPGHTTA